MDKFANAIVRYFVYVLTIRGFREAFNISYRYLQRREPLQWAKLYGRYKEYLMLLVGAVGVFVYMNERIVAEEFIPISIVYMVVQWMDMNNGTKTINYGTGMACSFIEGYLVQVLPNDGADFVGFEENIRKYEAAQGVVFPVKKLFLIVPKSLYCPPDLREFNKTDPKLPYLEACKSLEDVQRDVAGVKRRIYRNSAYKIHRPGGPVYLAAECPTALHTLHKVLQKRAVYEQLSTIDPTQIVEDFCDTLQSVVARMPDCRGKCELVYYDDTNPKENLADILLDKIRKIQPNFENIHPK